MLTTALSKKPRIPVEVHGIQHNFCKNPNCSLFGVPASQEKKYGDNTYIVVGGVKIGGAKNIPKLKCSCCDEVFPMKSNQAIHEEIERLSSYLNLATAKEELCCPNKDCTNHLVPLTTKKAYRSFGTAASGAKRLQCGLCKKTFSIPKPTAWQHDTHNNIDIFKLLMNKVPLRRIANITGVSWEVLYNRIAFIHRQCLAFSASRESKLKHMEIKRLYLSIDRQEYTVNWSERKDKRNISLQAITSVDNPTGYVFGSTPNFDPAIDKIKVEMLSSQAGDFAVDDCFRKYARLWLDRDYQDSAILNKSKKVNKKKLDGSLESAIENQYEESLEREDIEKFQQLSNTEQLPKTGVQIKSEYTMISHFFFLKNLMPKVEKWRFFMDQEAGIRAACFSAFFNEVKNRKAEAFYVSIEKNLTVDEKRKLKAASQKVFDEIQAANPMLTDDEIKLSMLMDEVHKMKEIGKWQDRWVKHPLPNMSEANKQVCWLTEHADFDMKHQAWLYHKASLHGVDSFFQKVRRRIAMLERPIHSAANAGRTWNGYGAYNPAMVGKSDTTGKAGGLRL